MKLSVPFYRQEQSHTCGPACLRMVLEFFGTVLTESELAQRCGTTRLGTGRAELAQAAIGLGFAAQLVDHLTYEDMEIYLRQGRPIIAVLDPSLLYPGVSGFAHGVVIVGVEANTVIYHDPELALHTDLTGDQPDYTANTVIYHDPELAADLAVSQGQFQAAWDRRDRKGGIVWKP